jgi:Fe-S-cluster containining protein
MSDSYFQYQASLAETKSDFQCPKECDAPGCWMDGVNVEVTLFDLVRLSLDLNTPVSDLFFHHCHIGLEVFEINPRYKRLLVKLNKPCPLLKETRCEVHGSKPLNCILFPEYHYIKGLVSELAKRPAFDRFPCLKEEIIVSDKRKKALKELKRMGKKEEALSNYFLFGVPSFIIDAKPLTRLLKKNNPIKGSFTIRDYNRLVHEKLKPTGIFDNIEKKVPILDERPGITRLFNQLKDDTLMDPLVEEMVKPETVFKIGGNQVKRLKRYLQPPEVIFM